MIENVTLTVIRDDFLRIRMHLWHGIHSAAPDIKLNQTEKFRQALLKLCFSAQSLQLIITRAGVEMCSLGHLHYF